MGVYIKGMEMPKSCDVCDFIYDLNVRDLGIHNYCGFPGIGVCVDDYIAARHKDCPLIEVPPHGRLIDADKLHKAMYHRAFETDGDTMWQSGCWVRYRAIEQVQDSQPTIIEAEEET